MLMAILASWILLPGCAAAERAAAKDSDIVAVEEAAVVVPATGVSPVPAISDSTPFHSAEEIFPPNPKHNHGSSIVETLEGNLLAVWFHGSGERSCDDVMVQGARKLKGEAKWREPFVAADTPDLPDCNPVVFIDPRGTLWLFWITVQDNQWGGSLLKYRTAADYEGDGPPKWNWQDVIHCRLKNMEAGYIRGIEEAIKKSAPKADVSERARSEVKGNPELEKAKLRCRLGWMTRIHPIMTSDRRIMLGLYSDVFNCSLAAFTEDWGGTWEFSAPMLGFGNIQPSFTVRKNGDIVAMMRDNGPFKKVRTATSKDGGRTWSAVQSLDIPNPGSSVECIALKSGNWLLICNDTSNGRHSLAIVMSDDEGRTWKWKRHLELWAKDKGSASYPSMIQTRDGMIHCTYSYTHAEQKGSCIRHAWFNEEWVKAGDGGK